MTQMQANTDLLARRERLLGRGMSTFYTDPVHLVRGSGVWLWDADGRKYLDCYNNVPHVGHCHPAVVEAIERHRVTYMFLPPTAIYMLLAEPSVSIGPVSPASDATGGSRGCCGRTIGAPTGRRGGDHIWRRYTGSPPRAAHARNRRRYRAAPCVLRK